MFEGERENPFPKGFPSPPQIQFPDHPAEPSPGIEETGGRWFLGKLRRNRAAAATIVKVSGRERGSLRGRGRTPF